MKTSLKAIGIALILVVGGLAAFYLWMVHGPVKEPDRPSTVPSTAVWIGLNKGEWIDCAVENHADGVVRCAIYSNVKGEKLSTGTYLWKSSAGKAAPSKIEVKSFDGENIYAEGAKLIPVGRHVYYGHGKDSWTKDYPTAARGMK